MKLAVIKTGGKQYQVAEGDSLKIEKLDTADQKIIFNEVLLTADGERVQVGRPLVAGAKVEAENLGASRSKKVLVFKYKSKTRHRVKRGHRQPFTQIKISKLDF
ncbi:MAG: 50S ribosomal protein L21 [Patescibacteria group bacterium]